MSNIEELISILIHKGFRYDINNEDYKVLVQHINKSKAPKWIKNICNLFKNIKKDSLIIKVTFPLKITKFQWIIDLREFNIQDRIFIYKYATTPITTWPEIKFLFSKNLDDLFEIITNDNSTELIQKIHLKNQIESMV